MNQTNKKYKGKVYHLNCKHAMCYITKSKRLICSDYHKYGTKSSCCRFTISEDEIEELLQCNNLSIEDVDKIYINEYGYYKIICKNGNIKSFDGHTIIL